MSTQENTRGQSPYRPDVTLTRRLVSPLSHPGNAFPLEQAPAVKLVSKERLDYFWAMVLGGARISLQPLASRPTLGHLPLPPGKLSGEAHLRVHGIIHIIYNPRCPRRVVLGKMWLRPTFLKHP